MTTTPDNINLLSPVGFKFAVKRLPNVSYFSQTVTLPSISIGSVEVPNALGMIPYPGAKLRYDPLTIRFKVDEDLKNYIEIHNWLRGLGHPVSLDETAALSRQNVMASSRVGAASTFVSDATLFVLTPHKNVSHMITFKDVFPTLLSEITFDSTSPDISYLDATVNFAYLRYDIEVLDN